MAVHGLGRITVCGERRRRAMQKWSTLIRRPTKQTLSFLLLTSRPVLCNYNEWLSTPRLGANSVTWRKTDGLLCQNFGARTGALWRRSPAVPFHLTQMPGFQSRGLHDQRDERAGHSSQGDTESSSRLRAHAPSWGDPQPKHPWESQESNRDNSHSSGGRGWGPLKTWTGLLGRLRGQASVTGMDARVLEQVALITVSTVLMSVCHTVLNPVLPLFAQQFHMEEFGTIAAGATISVFAVGRLLANMPAGQLADTFGRKAMLVWGPALTAGGMLMSGMSGSYIELLCWRLVTGVGSSMQMTGSQLFLGDISQKSNRARIMGTNQAAALLGLSIGPALGGVLATEVSLAAPFTVTAGLAALAALYGQFRLPETHPVLTRRVHESSREGSDPTPGALESGEREKAETEKDVTGRGGEAQQSRWDLVKGLLRNPKFLAILSVNTTLFLSTNGSRGVLMPLYTANALHWNTAEASHAVGTQVGALFSLMAVINMAGLLPASWAADRLGRTRIILPGMSLMGTALILASMTTSPGLFTACMALYALGQTINGSAPTAFAMDIMPEKSRGAALGIYRSAGDIGLLLGPAALGLIADLTSVKWGFVANGGALFLCAGALHLAVHVSRDNDTRRR